MISIKNNKSDSGEISKNNISSMVFFAPIASFPARHGGAIRSLRLFEEFTSQTGARATMIGTNFTLYIDGETRFLQDRVSGERTRFEGAVRSLLLRDHYLKAKQLNYSIVQEFLKEVARIQPDVVLMSYLYTTVLLPYLRNQKVFVETHNNDWEWFENLENRARNPLSRLVCRNSIYQTNRYMDNLTSNVSLVHVSNRDKEVYQKKRPDLLHFVVPNGCDVKPRPSRPSYEERPVKLLFVGSLSSSMNIDALEHFSRVFWPHLKGLCTLDVAGSNPPNSVVSICHKNHWNLHPNIADEELDSLYERAHFAILPFPYGCGSKLKLDEACGRGLPVLSTGPGSTGIQTELPSNVLVSDRPDEWAVRIRSPHFSKEMEEDAKRFAYLQSWELCGSTLLDTINSTFDLKK